MTAAGKKKSRPDGLKDRSLARLAAVQALYQMDLAGADVADVIDEFENVRFQRTRAAKKDEVEQTVEPGVALAGADPVFFGEVLRGVVKRQRDIDPMVDQQLATGWRLKRVDSTMRAILRAGVFELLERADVPARAVINEYVNVAHAFFDADEPKVVNGVLDALARRLRSQEFDGAASR